MEALHGHGEILLHMCGYLLAPQPVLSRVERFRGYLALTFTCSWLHALGNSFLEAVRGIALHRLLLKSVQRGNELVEIAMWKDYIGNVECVSRYIRRGILLPEYSITYMHTYEIESYPRELSPPRTSMYVRLRPMQEAMDARWLI